MRTVGEIVRKSVEYVQKRQGRPRREVEEWIAHSLGLRRLDLYLLFDRPVEEEELATIRSGLARLGAGEPLAYILELAPFYGLDFSVSPDVLIPRPETETLIEVAKSFIASQKRPGTIFDVCTGSGCVGLTLKTLFPTWHVVLSDISERALRVAKNNAAHLGVDVEFLQGDLLEPFGGRRAEVIVANPPYLSSPEWAALDPSVQSFEPRTALEAGPEGLEMFSRLLKSVPSHLASNGLCAVEIGAGQGAAILSLMKPFVHPFLVQDLAGRDRVAAFSTV